MVKRWAGVRPPAPFALAALLAWAALGLSGCAGGNDGSPRVLRVAVQAPSTGARAELGQAVRAGVELALEDRRAIFHNLGYRLEAALFDEGDPRQGVANAHLIAADPSVVGVVGHLSSDVAIPASEVYQQDGLPVITVAATAPEFTERGLANVFRLVPRDDAQGAAAARFADRVLKARRVFVLHDRTVYGQGLADAFKAEAERLGMRTLGYRGARRGDEPDLIRSVFLDNPDAVYFGGDEAVAARLVDGLRRIGLRAPFLAGDSLDAPVFARVAGEAAAGVYYTALGGRPEDTPLGRAWAERYARRFGAAPHPVAARSYDAALLLLDACARLLAERPAVRPERARVAAELRAGGEYEGVSGRIRFDERGDNALAGADAIRVLRLAGPVYPGEEVSPRPEAAISSPR